MTAALAALAGWAPAFAGEAHTLNPRCQEEVAHWARSRAVSETDHKAYSRQLSQLMAGRQIVALGSPVEGSGEFIQLRREILQYLVEEQAFNLFGIDAGFAECEQINRYLSEGQGDLKALLLSLRNYSWTTAEMEQTLGWLREYNSRQSPEHRVRFFGFDDGDPAQALPVVRAYLERVHSPLVNAQQQLELAYSLFEEYRRLPASNNADFQQRAGIIVSRVDDIAARMQRDKAQYLAQSSSGEFDDILTCLEHIKHALQWAVVQMQDNAPMYGARDRFMSKDIERVLRQKGAGRVVIWAHDVHVCKATHDDCGFALGDRPLGSYLAELHRDRYIAVGGVFGQGSFLASASSRSPLAPQVFELGSAPDGYLELSFAGLKRPPALIDVHALSASSPAAFCLLHDTFMRTVQSEWSRSSSGATPVRKDDYDALLYVDRINAAKAL